MDPHEPIYRLVAKFKNSIWLRFYRYDFIREGRESDCKIEGVCLFVILFCFSSTYASLALKSHETSLIFAYFLEKIIFNLPPE